LAGGYVVYAYVHDTAVLRAMRPGTGQAFGIGRAYNSGTIAVSSGKIHEVYAYDNSSIPVSGGSVDALYAYGASSVSVSDGSIDTIFAYNTSSVDISGGSYSNAVNAEDASNVDISGGSFYNMRAYGTSRVEISGGNIPYLFVRDTSSVDIYGGHVAVLFAFDNSVVTFVGTDFLATNGLSLAGDEVVGQGILTGKWLDGTPWSTNISSHGSGATIRVTPEPATLSLLALGGLAVMRRRRRVTQSANGRGSSKRQCHDSWPARPA